MKPSPLRVGVVVRSLIGWPVLALLVAGCASVEGVEGCIEQSDAALEEIMFGQLDSCSPAVAAWEREEARACGWVLLEDFRDE